MYVIGEYHWPRTVSTVSKVWKLMKFWTRGKEIITTFDNYGDARFVADRLNTSDRNRFVTFKVLELVEGSF